MLVEKEFFGAFADELVGTEKKELMVSEVFIPDHNTVSRISE